MNQDTENSKFDNDIIEARQSKNNYILNTEIIGIILFGLVSIALVIFGSQAYSGNHIIPATLCKASDPSTSFELKSRESGLENLSQVNTINIICPLPVQVYSEQSKNSEELTNLIIFVDNKENNSVSTECELTHQTGFLTESSLLPTSTNTAQTLAELTWEDIPYEKQSLSGYVISCAMQPLSSINAIQITINAKTSDEMLITGNYCAGATNPLEFGEETTFFRYLGNDITLKGRPNGSEFTLLGQISETPVKATFKIENSERSGSLKLEVGSLLINGWFTQGSCVKVDLSDVGIEKIGTSNVISTSQLNDISLFRSSAGHDASDDFEDCRSMKHYLEPVKKENQINLIHSPIDGTLVSLSGEEGGGFVDDQKTNQRIGIKSSLNPAYEITLYHVDVLEDLNLNLGQTLKAGQVLGYGRLVRVNSDDPEGSVADASNDFDISVSIGTTTGVAKVSYFRITSDFIFEEYMAWNSKITSRENLIISKTSRDEYPLSCDGEQFTNSNEDPLPRWISET